MKIGIRELKARAPQVVREVRETRESADITFRGEVVARLSPVDNVQPVDFSTAWQEFRTVARAVERRTVKDRKLPGATSGWRRTL